MISEADRRSHIDRALETLKLCGYPPLVLEMYELIEAELLLGDKHRAAKLEGLLLKLQIDIAELGIV